jgi:hypothetical protein
MTRHIVKRIHTTGGHLNVYLNLIETMEGRYYHLSVVNRDNKTITAKLKEAGSGDWRLLETASYPAWICELEDDLSNTISEASQPGVNARYA